MDCFSSEGVELATLIRKVEAPEDIFNPNQPKVIVNSSGDAIYFSRSVIPYIRDAEKEDWVSKHQFYKHIGLYAYLTTVLSEITRLPRSPLETAESLEQNRWIENGFRIRTTVTKWESIGIDSPEDLEKAKLIIDDFDKIS
jgi:3-deoxy-manno-octulosonate cytidylyltransferase (CMP-KDO synthetase)